MRTITFDVEECRPKKCLFYTENDGGGHCEGWDSCALTKREIKLWETKGDFPKFCPAKEKK
jgi:hypothetical protein